MAASDPASSGLEAPVLKRMTQVPAKPSSQGRTILQDCGGGHCEYASVWHNSGNKIARNTDLAGEYASFDLDALDSKILAALQDDGRLSNVELAERVGLSPSPCLRRVKRLEED